MFRNILHLNGDELTPRPTLRLEDHPLFAVPDSLFSKFAATLYIVETVPSSAPFRGDRDPLITEYYINKSQVHHYMRLCDCQ
jgi:hypothetical protein